MKMIDMAKTPAEVNEAVKSMSAPVSATVNDMPVYPYGLCISLEEDELEKLKLDGVCEAGDMIHIAAMAKVTSISQRDTEGGVKRRVELQITHLGTEDEDKETDGPMARPNRSKRYRDPEPGEGEMPA
jgi:hypothetical protein